MPASDAGIFMQQIFLLTDMGCHNNFSSHPPEAAGKTPSHG
jgi:hypothetical protein